MKTRSTASALLIALFPLLSAISAHAETASDASTRAARARFQEGVEFYDKGQFENARASFLQAYALRRHPAVLLNLAQSSLRSGHALEASKYFQQFLRESTSLTPVQKADAERGLSEARSKLGHIDVTAPAGTALSLDGESIGKAPLSEGIEAEPGVHALSSRTADGTTETARVNLSAGQQITIKLGEIAPPQLLAPISAAATPSKPVGVATHPPEGAASRSPSASKPTTITSTDALVRVDADTSGRSIFSPPSNMVPVYIAGAAGLAGLGSALTFGLLKINSQSSADSIANEVRQQGGGQGICVSNRTEDVIKYGKACEALVSANRKVDSYATVANISLVAGAVGVGVAAGWYLFAPKRPASSGDSRSASTTTTPELIPVIGPGVGGLSMSGRF